MARACSLGASAASGESPAAVQTSNEAATLRMQGSRHIYRCGSAQYCMLDTVVPRVGRNMPLYSCRNTVLAHFNLLWSTCSYLIGQCTATRAVVREIQLAQSPRDIRITNGRAPANSQHMWPNLTMSATPMCVVQEMAVHVDFSSN